MVSRPSPRSKAALRRSAMCEFRAGCRITWTGIVAILTGLSRLIIPRE
jgi:uncharacterized protein YjeT (DUF2065 family)